MNKVKAENTNQCRMPYGAQRELIVTLGLQSKVCLGILLKSLTNFSFVHSQALLFHFLFISPSRSNYILKHQGWALLWFRWHAPALSGSPRKSRNCEPCSLLSLLSSLAPSEPGASCSLDYTAHLWIAEAVEFRPPKVGEGSNGRKQACVAVLIPSFTAVQRFSKFVI